MQLFMIKEQFTIFALQCNNIAPRIGYKDTHKLVGNIVNTDKNKN